MNTFLDKLQQATNEDKQVNKYYVEEIKKVFPKVANGGGNRIDTDSIIYPDIKTDGIYRCYYINNDDGIEYNYLLQIECKLDVDFSDTKARANVLLQVCCYLKQLHDKELGYNGSWESNMLPKVIVLGSKVNCLALSAKLLFPFAMGYIEGYKSASTAYSNPSNAPIIENICNDANIQAQSIIYNTNDKDCISRLCEEIIKLGKGLKITDDLSEHTISLAFDFFDMYVLDKKSSEKLTSREKVDLFVGTFFNEEFEETKSSRNVNSTDKLRIHGIEVKVDPVKYNQFKLLYNMREYSRLEQKQITAITDRLIEDTDRRRKGDFYTPSIWVDEAHKLLDKNLGENWREEYMVWDCAWGTGNLTRDYQFADLYCSTLQEEDLNIGYRYNKNAVKFQYDFLNDDVEDMEEILQCCRLGIYDTANEILYETKIYKQAPGLVNALLGINLEKYVTDGIKVEVPKKKLVFLINPPYGTAKNGGADSKSKKGIAVTKVNQKMLEDNIGACAQQLYAQFMYRIFLIKQMFQVDISVGMFSPPAYICGSSYNKFRKAILDDFAVADGFVIQASQFADVSDAWGITFTLLNKHGSYENVNVSVLDVADGHVKKIKDKRIYNLDNNETLSDWIKVNGKGEDAPQMVSAINWRVTPNRGKLIEGALGYLVFGGNNIEQSKQLVIMLPSCFNTGNGVSITEENILKCCMGFAARKLMASQCDWINCKDEYMTPSLEKKEYNQFEADSIIYSLFHSGSNQSSLVNAP